MTAPIPLTPAQPQVSAETRARVALSCWAEYAFTRALRAVDAGRVTAEARGAAEGPLHGLLFSVKDLFPVAGVESCAGSLLLRGSVPESDPPLVGALRQAGAVVLGKGVCAEFGFGTDTENRLDGRVRHFRDPALSPGGSSGGDAVAVGAGIADFAVAGDYGGSVRWPAQAAGVLGLRLGTAHPLAGPASTGRIGLAPPRAADASLQSRTETAGLMARSPAVLGAVLAALAAPARGGPARKTLLVSDGTEIAAVRPEVARAVTAAAAAAERAGYRLVAAPAGLRAALCDARSLYAALRAATDDHREVRRLAAGREEQLCESTLAVLEQSERALASPGHPEVAALCGRAEQIRLAVRAALRAAGAGALLLPLAPSGPVGFAATTEVAGRRLSTTDLMAHCRAVSLTGLPALSLPTGQGPSVQLVGADRGEERLCAVAADLVGAGLGAVA
ncbi:MAG TPA: amidase [Trebonia sp.]|jgi:amidase